MVTPAGPETFIASAGEPSAVPHRDPDMDTKTMPGSAAARTGGAAPAVAAVRLAFPPHRYGQDELASALVDFAGPEFRNFAAGSGVQARNIALPLSRYSRLSGFTEANDAYLDVALELGERALRAAFDEAEIAPSEVDVIFSTTVTGLAVPSLEARLATRLGMRSDVKRVPLFGLGCAAGAAGMARMHDYLRAFPGHVAVLLAVELCSLTIQRQDHSMANLAAANLFGDGAGAVIAIGSGRAPAGPTLLATHSRLYPDTGDVLGWDIGADGFRIVLSAEVATVIEKYLGDDVRRFLDGLGLSTADIATWICHTGGPRVIEAVENTLDLPVHALDRTRKSLRDNGNLSSVSVLDVLRANLDDPPPPGSYGLMMAMGPGFCSELVLLGW